MKWKCFIILLFLIVLIYGCGSGGSSSGTSITPLSIINGTVSFVGDGLTLSLNAPNRASVNGNVTLKDKNGNVIALAEIINNNFSIELYLESFGDNNALEDIFFIISIDNKTFESNYFKVLRNSNLNLDVIIITDDFNKNYVVVKEVEREYVTNLSLRLWYYDGDSILQLNSGEVFLFECGYVKRYSGGNNIEIALTSSEVSYSVNNRFNLFINSDSIYGNVILSLDVFPDDLIIIESGDRDIIIPKFNSLHELEIYQKFYSALNNNNYTLISTDGYNSVELEYANIINAYCLYKDNRLLEAKSLLENMTSNILACVLYSNIALKYSKTIVDFGDIWNKLDNHIGIGKEIVLNIGIPFGIYNSDVYETYIISGFYSGNAVNNHINKLKEWLERIDSYNNSNAYYIERVIERLY